MLSIHHNKKTNLKCTNILEVVIRDQLYPHARKIETINRFDVSLMYV